MRIKSQTLYVELAEPDAWMQALPRHHRTAVPPARRIRFAPALAPRANRFSAQPEPCERRCAAWNTPGRIAASGRSGRSEARATNSIMRLHKIVAPSYKASDGNRRSREHAGRSDYSHSSNDFPLLVQLGRLAARFELADQRAAPSVRARRSPAREPRTRRRGGAEQRCGGKEDARNNIAAGGSA
jgi:hypothetical protein